MNTSELAAIHEQFLVPTYKPELALVKGRGAWVWDLEGNKYLDFLAGISVLNVGHCHPKVVRALKRQSKRLMHVSNLYYNEHQPKLARVISEKSLGGKVFFCNSGAEANEGLIKLARKWGSESKKHEIITFRNSFHGRTLATLSATGQEKVQTGFAPLLEGFRYALYNDLKSVKEKISDHTAAVLVECVQGEGGVVPADPEFMKGLEKLCNQHGILLLVDEIQTGMGRTGDWFAYQGYGIRPHAISTAKALGNGFPMGAISIGPEMKDVFQPGSHGSTFGGTPLACSVGLAVFEVIEEEKLLENVKVMTDYLISRMNRYLTGFPEVKEIRNRGLMIGIVTNGPAAQLQQEMQKRGLLVVATAGNVIRLLPPLTINKAEARKAVKIMKQSFETIQSNQTNETNTKEEA